MLLHTPAYLLFLLGISAGYWLLPRATWRLGWLVAASYVFYASFDARFTLLLLLLTLAVYGLGRAIPGRPPAQARALAWASVAVNLGVLGVFKYADFFVGAAEQMLLAAGLPAANPALRLLLPLGISFYAFQGIAYTTEIYRQRAKPAQSWLHVAAYLAFFPKLIAGPMVRPQAFLQQLDVPAVRPTTGQLGQAAGLLLLGLFKKRFIADSLAVLADTAFRAADWPGGGAFSTPLYWQGFYLYAFLIYADFSGYTDIARASALLFGMELPENFRQPYLAVTLTDFWNRWHMTLTQWFREYFYFPLTRSLLGLTQRRFAGTVQVAANLVTMTVIGLWHGAAWTFIIWGLWHGAGLTLERWARFRPVGRWRQLAAGLLTFHAVALGWLFFRATSGGAALRFLRGLLAFEQMHWLSYYAPVVLVTAALIFALDLVSGGYLRLPEHWWARWRPTLVLAALVALICLGLLDLARGGESRPFIYGQF